MKAETEVEDLNRSVLDVVIDSVPTPYLVHFEIIASEDVFSLAEVSHLNDRQQPALAH